MSIRDYLGGDSEEETPRDGLLSSRPEWHGAGIGAFCGLLVGLNGAKDGAWIMVLLAGLAFGTRKAQVGQLEDVNKEPAYALGAATLMFLVTVFVILPRIP